MPPTFFPYCVLYLIEGFGKRQLSTVPTQAAKDQLISAIKSNGGRPDGDWFRFSTADGFNKAMDMTTKELKGIVFDLTGERGPGA
jgi:hypothetical protein